ncbi:MULTISPECIES: sensor domain-containing protein [Brevibacterium]|uniref:sensor domain-containing protein n=1 Tax=Brevibacterium TaxID=1696 RepID=UPI001BADCBF2|nr:sensor domain-containing protein [Brevibacterium sp. W7.2]
MKRALPVIALAAGLALTGCTSGGSSDSDDSGSGSQPAAEETQQSTQLDEAALKNIIDTTQFDGKTFKTVDTGAISSGEAAKALEQAEFEPAECKDLAMAGLNAAQATDGTTVAGIASDNSMSIGLSSFPDEAATSDQFSTSSKMAETCGDVTMTMSGMEMNMKSETFDATVPGADEAVGTTTSMEAGGQSAMSTQTVVARVGNTVVTAANMSPNGDEQDAVKVAEEAVKAVQAAG